MTSLKALGLLLICALLTSTAFSQNQPQPSQEQQDLQQQMQDSFRTIMQNMMDKGVDPRQFFQQMQQGADPADIMKQLVDQGLADQKMLDQLQATSQKLTTLNLRAQLDCTDVEWATLQPLIQKVMAASAAVGSNGGPGGGMMRMGQFGAAPSPTAAEISKAKRALAAAIKDPNTTPEQFQAALKDVRDARDKARQELDSARKDLVSVLTLHQEGALVQMGIIE